MTQSPQPTPRMPPTERAVEARNAAIGAWFIAIAVAFVFALPWLLSFFFWSWSIVGKSYHVMQGAF